MYLALQMHLVNLFLLLPLFLVVTVICELSSSLRYARGASQVEASPAPSSGPQNSHPQCLAQVYNVTFKWKGPYTASFTFEVL